MSDLSTTTTFDGGRGGFTAHNRREDVVFRRAMRHSRMVRVLRVGVPATLAVCVVVLGAMTYFDPLRALKRLPASVDQVVVSGTKITMAAPKLSGFTRDSRKYDLTARAATQDITQPNLLEMEGITAAFETQDKVKLDLTAATGLFDRKTGLLTLKRDVLLVSSNGYQVRLDEVRVDTGTGNIVSETPVQVQMLQGTLNAKRLEVLKSGEVLTFDGGVKMTIVNTQDTTPEKAGNP